MEQMAPTASLLGRKTFVPTAGPSSTIRSGTATGYPAIGKAAPNAFIPGYGETANDVGVECISIEAIKRRLTSSEPPDSPSRFS